MAESARPRLLSVEAVAAWLDLPERTVQNLAAKDALHGAKFGRQWRFRVEDVEAFIAKQFGEPTLIKAAPPVRKTRPVQLHQPARVSASGFVPVFDVPPLSREQLR